MSFSIVVPLYNKVRSIEKTLFSVLQQSYTDFEVIIIDDGSTDDGGDIVDKIDDHRLTMVKQENMGVSAARNKGAEIARYPYLVFVDADDELAPDYLKHMVELTNYYPNAGAYCTRYHFVKENNYTPCKIHQMKSQMTLFTDYFDTASRGDLPLIASGVCIPQKVLAKVGVFSTLQIQGEDQDLWSRIALRFPIAVHPSYDIRYNLDAENRVSQSNIPKNELAFSRILQNKLEHKKIPEKFIKSIKRYIAGHLIHLAELNIRTGLKSDAWSLLKDRRTNSQLARRIKWVMALLVVNLQIKAKRARRLANGKAQQKTVVHLVNDRKMGGITSTLNSLSKSIISKQYRFVLDEVNPEIPKLKKYNSDIVVVHYASSWATILTNLLVKLSNLKSSLILHEHHYTKSFEAEVPSKIRFRLMLKINYALFDKVVAVSRGQAGWVKSCRVISKNRLIAIPQCNDLKKYLGVARKKISNGITIGAYGRLVPAKGFDTLIEAFNKVDNPKLSLVIGGSGPEEEKLKQTAGSNSQISFVGRVDDVPAFLSNCDLVIIPSVTEAFGQVCLESKAAGKAVIVSDLDGLREQVVTPSDAPLDEQCGNIIKHHSVRDIEEILRQIPSMPLRRWGDNGRENVRFAWQVYQRRWEDLFKAYC